MKMSSPINPVSLANPINRVYLPDVVGGGYGDFWRCKARYRVLKGSKGSKKSATTALNYITRIMQYPGSNLLVIRKIGDNHRSSTFAMGHPPPGRRRLLEAHHLPYGADL